MLKMLAWVLLKLKKYRKHLNNYKYAILQARSTVTQEGVA